MKSPTRFAFAGFRHGHIFDLLFRIQQHADCTITGMAEDDAATRESLADREDIRFSHESVDALLNEGNFDVLAIGDYYGRRGELVIRALKAGKHVIADKPICTCLEELEQIEELVRDSNGKLHVGCQLDLRTNSALATLRSVIQSGRLGEIQTISAGGQHPLLLGVRPGWYFEEGKHGGTINDIGVHLFDLVPWLTGLEITETLSAYEWNAKAKDFPHFKDCAQFHLRLSNGGGLLGDMSYLNVDGLGYSVPHYWRFTVHGLKGFAETSSTLDHVSVVTDTSKEVEKVALQECAKGKYLEDFLSDLAGNPSSDGLTTPLVLKAARQALEIQSVADRR